MSIMIVLHFTAHIYLSQDDIILTLRGRAKAEAVSKTGPFK